MSQGETPNESPTNTDRRSFIKAAAITGGALAASGIAFPSVVKAASSPAQPQQVPLPPNLAAPSKANHWFLPATDKTVHWGYFSKSLKPVVEIESGDFVTLECLTHQAGDDYERMIKGDPGAESVYYWSKDQKNVNRRGAGPMDAPVGAGGGEGVHICTGPIYGILKNVRVPIRPHFGVLGVAPKEVDMVSSIPPNYTGGNIDNWRIGKGGTMYYPVSVDGALLSAGDTHAAQGDSELCGTAIESSWTGLFQIVLHKQNSLAETILTELNWPLLETKEEWVVHGFSYPQYLTQLGPDAQHEIYKKSAVDLAMRDAYRKVRDFLMRTQKLSEDEVISLISVAVDFGVTQVVDGNWGVHATVKKNLFAGSVE